MIEHTFGPLRVVHRKDADAELFDRFDVYTDGLENDVAVAYITRLDGPRAALAYARLLASAPGLLNALEQCAAVMKAEGKGDEDAEYTNALAAIKKARGEP